MVVAMLATFAFQTVVKPDCRRRTVTGISPRCQAGCNELENCARNPWRRPDIATAVHPKPSQWSCWSYVHCTKLQRAPGLRSDGAERCALDEGACRPTQAKPEPVWSVTADLRAMSRLPRANVRV